MIPRVLVIGDFMEDRWFIGTSNRMAVEAPVPVVVLKERQDTPGGAGNVKLNLIALGAEVESMYGLISIKNRLCIGDKVIARWDESDYGPPIAPMRLERVNWTLLNAVVISDYGKGAVTQRLIDRLAVLTDQFGLPVFVDTRRSPDDFPMDWTFFPNEAEYCQRPRVWISQAAVVHKRGAEGIRYEAFGRILEEYPAWAKSVVCVAGAGDTVLAGYVYATCVGWRPLAFANACAAVAVSKPWTSTVTVSEALDVLRTNSSRGVQL